ncbi:MAG: hypothetical protein AAFR75_03425, partial [Pseudomonadota bacterium]
MFQALRRFALGFSAIVLAPVVFDQPVVADPARTPPQVSEHSRKQQLVAQVFKISEFGPSLDGWRKLFVGLDPTQCGCAGQDNKQGRM